MGVINGCHNGTNGGSIVVMVVVVTNKAIMVVIIVVVKAMVVVRVGGGDKRDADRDGDGDVDGGKVGNADKRKVVENNGGKNIGCSSCCCLSGVHERDTTKHIKLTYKKTVINRFVLYLHAATQERQGEDLTCKEEN